MLDPKLIGAATVALRDGVLPDVFVAHFRGGHGQDETCALCRADIPRSELIACIDVGSHGYCLHMPCFLAWQSVITEPRGSRRAGGIPAPAGVRVSDARTP